jgi:hypothetical protein
MLLTGAMRARIPTSKFALPGERKYPIEDPSHARNAIARAAQQLNAGNLTQAQHDEIVSKAHRKLVGGAIAGRG